METSQELEGCRQEEHLRPNPHDARRLKKMSSVEMICFLILTAETIVKIYKYSGIALLADKVRRGRSSLVGNLCSLVESTTRWTAVRRPIHRDDNSVLFPNQTRLQPALTEVENKSIAHQLCSH